MRRVKEVLLLIRLLKKHISDNEIEEILNIIKNQYRKYKHLVSSAEFQSLFSEEYAPHNKQHGISWAISSAFPSGSSIANRLTVRKLNYGRGHTRPELTASNIKLHILSNRTDFDATYLKECYKLNSNNFAGEQLYCFIKYTVSGKQLDGVSLCLPDENGEIVAEKILIDKVTLGNFAA